MSTTFCASPSPVGAEGEIANLVVISTVVRSGLRHLNRVHTAVIRRREIVRWSRFNIQHQLVFHSVPFSVSCFSFFFSFSLAQGDRPCAFLLPKREEYACREDILPAAMAVRWGQMNVADWLKVAVQMLVATGIVAAVGCFGWTVLGRQNTRPGGAVEACIGALVGSPKAKKIAENGNSTRGSNGDSAAANSGSGSLAHRESTVGVGPSGSTCVAPALNTPHETNGRASSQLLETTSTTTVRRKAPRQETERPCECVSNGR